MQDEDLQAQLKTQYKMPKRQQLMYAASLIADNAGSHALSEQARVA